jgi:hypothetical protein
MVETLHEVAAGLDRFNRRFVEPSKPVGDAGDDLVRAAHNLYSTFLEAEANHVSLGLGEEQAGFQFTLAQSELAGWRNRFADVLGDARARRRDLDERAQRELGRIDMMARKAPLTTAADLEQIRLNRLQTRMAV